LATSAVSVVLAGCSGSDDDSASTDTATPTDQPEQTDTTNTTEQPEQTETTSEPAPTLDEFEYPEGASQDGIDSKTLYSTHESTLTESGSLTYELTFTENIDGNEYSRAETNKLDAGNKWRRTENDGQTETTWSPAGEQLAYVQLESGFETGYRIENQALKTNQVAGLNIVRDSLRAEWGEASEVIETEDGYAVVYESTGVGQVGRIFADELTSFEATVTVSEGGVVRNMTQAYEGTIEGKTYSSDGEASVTAVGDTTLAKPEWAATARADGLQIKMEQTGGQTAVKLEMLNGKDLSSTAKISPRDGQGGSRGEIGGGTHGRRPVVSRSVFVQRTADE